MLSALTFGKRPVGGMILNGRLALLGLPVRLLSDYCLGRTMLKRSILLVAIAATFIFQMFVQSAMAIELDVDTRTVKLNEEGETIVLSQEQAANW